jgi:hypothetical protein
MFTVGQKAVCICDKFNTEIAKLYAMLPVAGVTYVIRDVRLGIREDCKTGDVSLLLIGLVNPKANSRAALERGFSETRFRPLTEMRTRNTELQKNLAPKTPDSVEASVL